MEEPLKMNELSRQVLVVEDDYGLMSLIVRLLNKSGFEASGVVSGTEALEWLLSNTASVLLLDQQLPDMTGRDIINALNERGENISFVMMTGQGDERLAVEMMKLGAADYLVKDINFTDILPGVLTRVFRNIDTEQRLKIAEEELKESEIRLRELNATKDKFFSIIAHDLKNPFNSIIGLSNLLVEQVNENNYEGISEYAEIIQKSSQRAFDLLLNLLEWSRSQTGRMMFNPEYIEVIGLIREVVELLEDSAKQKKIVIYSENHRNAPVMADKAMISTILRNLISNSIKFTNPGGEILISAVQIDDELRICISDNGVGIKESIIGKLFRIDENNSTNGTNNEKGTGLGLILCKEFVEKHGGTIWVESEPGVGSKFYFTIKS